jgi:glutamate racemase
MELPSEAIVYLADQAHVPYGSRSMDEVRRFSESISRYLIRQGCKLIVVACNTASAAALHSLRQAFSTVPFVGMEPAVKPAAEATQTGIVGVLATPATFQGELYASVVERFASGVEILQSTCAGLVEQIETGKLNSTKIRDILQSALQPMLQRGIDTIVLGCTHYPFVIPSIQEIAGDSVRVIDPAPAVARQVQRVLAQNGLLGLGGSPAERSPGQVKIITTAHKDHLEALLPNLIGEEWPVQSIDWESLVA